MIESNQPNFPIAERWSKEIQKPKFVQWSVIISNSEANCIGQIVFWNTNIQTLTLSNILNSEVQLIM